jgi:hypothetical protein
MKRPPTGPSESRLFDGSVVSIALVAIGCARLEGLGPALTFATRDSASVTMMVAASPTRVWQEVGKATYRVSRCRVYCEPSRSPLPSSSMKAPVLVRGALSISKDERGRVISFSRLSGGRTQKPFSKPFQMQVPSRLWMRHRSLTFRVEPAGVDSRLIVASDYDRLLSPCGFSAPISAWLHISP